MLNITEIEEILLNVSVDKEIHNKIIQLAELLEQEKKNERESDAKKSKYKLTVFIRGDKELAEKVQQAWVTKTLEELPDETIVGKLQEAAGMHNAASKKKRNYITTFADLFEFLKRKFSKEVGVAISTKTPVRVIVLENSDVCEQINS
jgi:hypothetical protein